MARELSTPLTQEDLVFLRQRHTEAYVQRMIDLNGVADEAESAAEADGEGSGDPEADPDASEGGEPAEDDEDDLIGDAPQGEYTGEVETSTYNPLGHTTNEVRQYLKTASVGERNRVKVLERERTDREPRSSILNYDPS